MFVNFTENCAELFTKAPRENTEIIFQPQDILVNFKFNNTLIPKTCSVLVEKLKDRDLMQIRIAEQNEIKMYTSTINVQSFNALKQNQSLHVTFIGFIDNVLQMLQMCQKQQLHISISNQDETNEVLQFYEVRPFKNLVHLTLPIQEASLVVVNFHLRRMIEDIQKRRHIYETTIQDLRKEIDVCTENISEIKKENKKLKEDNTQQKQIYYRKLKFETDEMQNKLKNLIDSKESEQKQYQECISQLQSKMDLILLEKSNAIKEKSEEVKKNEKILAENSQLMNSNTHLKKINDMLLREINTFKKKDKTLNSRVHDMTEKISRCEEKISHLEKIKSELEAELQAEKKICCLKRNALEVATDEITKANDIISKQTIEIKKLKKNLDWRTEIALQQELAMEKKDQIIQNLKSQIFSLEKEFQNLRSESKNLPIEITLLKQKAEAIENDFNQRIKHLKGI